MNTTVVIDRRLKCDCGELLNMAVDLTDQVQEIADAKGVPESEVFEQALERGVEDMWLDLVIARYLDGEISRAEAVESVGEERLRRAEREGEAVVDDVRWGSTA